MKNTEILLDADRCSGCGRCIDACRRGVLQLSAAETGSRVVQVAAAERCAACRACERTCPRQAIVIRKTAGRKPDPKRMLQGVLPILLALALTLPRSLEPAAWHAVDYWKMFGLFVLFHILFCHTRIPKILKKHDEQ
ncbi:MAG: ferredoxin family protein [Alistipes sp.]|nr:ferredoxin family protein [Alistipes senegalensis]MCM1250649.1 ferredoxin family protein [Alistipes sp.]